MFARITQLAKVFTQLGLGLIFLFILFWGISPHIIGFNTSQNIVIINYNKDGQRGKIYFAQLLPHSHSWRLYKLDDLTEIKALGSSEKYYLTALDPLMQRDEMPMSSQLATWSWALNVRVDEIWRWRGDFEPTTKPKLKAKLRSEIFTNPDGVQATWKQLKQFFFLRTVASENYVYNPEPTSLERLSTLLEPVYFENCSVAVVNTTPTPGLARQLTDLVESSGAIVLRVVDQPEAYLQSTLAVSPDKPACEAVVTAVSLFFPQEVQVVTQPELNQQQRADLVIMIGQDLASEFE